MSIRLFLGLHFGFWIPRTMKIKLPELTHHFQAHTLPSLRHHLDIQLMLPKGHLHSVGTRQKVDGMNCMVMEDKCNVKEDTAIERGL